MVPWPRDPRGIRSPPVKGKRQREGACHAGEMDTQDAPIQDGSDDASNDDKIAGIAEQMRADAAAGAVDDLRSMARQRLEEANMPADDATVDAVVATVEPE
jgi:hypothetical protein